MMQLVVIVSAAVGVVALVLIGVLLFLRWMLMKGGKPAAGDQQAEDEDETYETDTDETEDQ